MVTHCADCCTSGSGVSGAQGPLKQAFDRVCTFPALETLSLRVSIQARVSFIIAEQKHTA